MNRINDEINFIALEKKESGERYVWKYEDHQRADVLRAFGRFAANPELNFSWYDAAVLSKEVREQQQHPQ